MMEVKASITDVHSQRPEHNDQHHFKIKLINKQEGALVCNQGPFFFSLFEIGVL